jgi:hypothetical protein
MLDISFLFSPLQLFDPFVFFSIPSTMKAILLTLITVITLPHPQVHLVKSPSNSSEADYINYPTHPLLVHLYSEQSDG